jgi:hypothetical protein
MAVPILEELEEPELGNLNCDVNECDRRARYLVVWACHVKLACAECGVEIADRAWPDVAMLFRRKKSPTCSDGSTRPRRARAKSSLSVVN